MLGRFLPDARSDCLTMPRKRKRCCISLSRDRSGRLPSLQRPRCFTQRLKLSQLKPPSMGRRSLRSPKAWRKSHPPAASFRVKIGSPKLPPRGETHFESTKLCSRT
uniref:(northern house mosquito) hypothetical protein n=1 Tax=Culex pipiens TaxID=7175 RepID=A0A8D8DYI8_CULPI